MIKSGLVKQKRGGGFEEGYPSQTPKGNIVERPFVATQSNTVYKKSAYSSPLEYKPTTPSPVVYNDLFGQKTTADERLYILRQIQQGVDKIQRDFVRVPKGLPEVPSLPAKPILPSTGQPQVLPRPPTVPTLEEDEGIDIDGYDPQDLLEEEEIAVDVVEGPWYTHTDTLSHRIVRDVTAGTLGFIGGDLPGAATAIAGARVVDEMFHFPASQINQTILSNGSGPRRRKLIK